MTGGEPTLQKEPLQLVQLLKQYEHHLTIETNTTLFPESVISPIDLWSLSSKLSSAGEKYLRHPIIEQFLKTLQPVQQQWKFVICDSADEQQLRNLPQRHPPFKVQRIPIILQPEGNMASLDYSKALEQLAERVHDPFWNHYYVRILPQMHVIIWGKRR